MKEKIGILAGGKNQHAGLIEQALQKKGIIAKRFAIGDVVAQIGMAQQLVHENDDLCQLDALLVRGVPGGSLEQVIFRLDILHKLNRSGVLVINSPTAIEKTVDKYYASVLLAEHGIPTPKTVVVEKMEPAMAAFKKLGDVVVKPLFGSLGNGMVRVNDAEVAYRVFKSLELGRYVYYLQEYIPHEYQDMRAFVIGMEVVAAMVRRGTNWKTNLSKGAVPLPIVLTAQQEELCIRAVQALGADYGGVDLLVGEDGANYVIEVNSIPGWLGLQQVTDVNIPKKLVHYLLEKLALRGRDRFLCQGVSR